MPTKSELWGATKKSVLQLPCEEAPATGRPITINARGVVSTQNGLTGQGIQDGSIGIEKLSGAIRSQFFGGGFDGQADFDGAATILGHAPAANVYTLVRDISCTKMWVRTGVTVRPAGHRIMARELFLIGTAIIHGDGSAGGNAGTPTAGAKGDPPRNESSANTGTTIGGGDSGGPGGAGGATPSETGANGVVGEDITVGLGGDGAAGTNGTAGGGPGGGPGGGQAGGTVSGTNANILSLDNITRLMRGPLLIHGGAGGGGAGGGGANSAGADGGGGGGGGAGGGVVLVVVDKLTLDAWTGRISGNGGDGGAGAEGSGTAGVGGGGGGGGGGGVVVVYAELAGGSLKGGPVARAATSTPALKAAEGSNVQAWGGQHGSVGGGPAVLTLAQGGTVLVIGPRPFEHHSEFPWPQRPRPRYRRKLRLRAAHRAITIRSQDLT